ncbi:GAF domain-containing sensor histidine kinase [Desulfobacula phenolica]|uniref:histidine kinase n=1 Tax=Desulfobacula phenolica TaxID=90732 RepID=A0A1H2JXL4_9BACT|nr:sensor histidine kinase [Desulfobacula phenolica]SDU61160.1 His Kinase A (phospho-acceptor) domain-containing protein [Desulfobacula phenolica]
MEKDLKIKKIERLNLVLRTIRDVGRLLISENNREKLIKGICNILVEKRGYYNAWIGLFSSGKFSGNFSGKASDKIIDLIADSGMDIRFDDVKKNIENQIFTRCVEHTLVSKEVFSTDDPIKECADCLLSENYSHRGALAVRLEYEETNYGFMVVSIPKELALDETEKNIVKEISNDIAFGLYRLELEEKRKFAEQDRKQSQVRFKTLIENSLNCISIIQNHKIVYKKAGLRKIHGLMTDVFQPPGFLDVYVDDRARIKKLYIELLSNKIKHIQTDFRYSPFDEDKADPEIRWAFLSATKINYLGVESVLTNIMDITDSKEGEDFLRIQDKMTSLGRVTAGIAHEIRNPLSGIYIYLKALKKIYNQMGDITKVVSIIDKIELASYKIESIIKRVMDFSKPSQPQFIMTNLNDYIDEVTKLTSVTLRKSGIRFEKYLDPNIPKCFAEPHLIEQVILNLITNAAEAMKEFQGEKLIILKTFKKDNNVVISVRDTGPGIPLSGQSKIFDPFYTTKSNSSGIGLSICHRIILDHGGALKFHTTKNGGARFIIELPIEHKEG